MNSVAFKESVGTLRERYNKLGDRGVSMAAILDALELLVEEESIETVDAKASTGDSTEAPAHPIAVVDKAPEAPKTVVATKA